MIDNHIRMENGVIRQVVIDAEIEYNVDYVINSYCTYGERVEKLSLIRYDYLISVLNFIPNSILDVGYGSGNFLKTCKLNIEHCYGNDITGYELPPGVEFVEDITKEYYDVICFFDSLEHFVDISFVKDLKCKYIYISVPECHYINDEWFLNWKHFRPNEHIYYFDRFSLTNFMREHGFHLIAFSNIEDSIRTPYDKNLTNILTGIFKKEE